MLFLGSSRSWSRCVTTVASLRGGAGVGVAAASPSLRQCLRRGPNRTMASSSAVEAILGKTIVAELLAASSWHAGPLPSCGRTDRARRRGRRLRPSGRGFELRQPAIARLLIDVREHWAARGCKCSRFDWYMVCLTVTYPFRKIMTRVSRQVPARTWCAVSTK